MNFNKQKFLENILNTDPMPRDEVEKNEKALKVLKIVLKYTNSDDIDFDTISVAEIDLAHELLNELEPDYVNNDNAIYTMMLSERTTQNAINAPTKSTLNDLDFF